ncbi:MAG: MogA/MoaB family molybdenum cofactor biosynthesis protein [Nitrospirae bacterium]|nr:MAG: MogA/MoaB family molybdenum cofactor biosynthesis protein [Nitrospirota bacterium]
MIKVSVLTLSDKASKGEREDLSGPLIRDIVKGINGEVIHYEIIADELNLIKEKLISFSKDSDIVFTTGGTGLTPRDVTPEATMDVIDRLVPGIAEVMRMEGMKKTPNAMLSRALAGVRGECLIINLPGSPKAVKESLEAIIGALPHAVEKIKGSTSECARHD